MRFLADENLSGEIVESLRDQGHDLLWIREYCRGISDDKIIDIAISEKRIILTFDKDFGMLVYRSGMNEIPGIVLVRIDEYESRKENLLKFINEYCEELDGYFIVLNENRIRRRKLRNDII